MNTLQINHILRHHYLSKKYYVGCFAADQIPVHLSSKYPYTFIANTDAAINPGQHWVAFYVRNMNTVEYFDSMGDTPNKHISQYLEMFPTIIINKQVLQSPITEVCGQFCIYFVLRRCAGTPFRDIVKSLSNKKNSDNFVRNFVVNLIK